MVTTGFQAHRSSTLPHEVGHSLDLLHTHQGRPSGDNRDAGNCKQEAVSRAKHQGFGCQGWFPGKKKCEVNGDGYCDTEADPNIARNVTQNAQGDWIYGGNDQDNWNEDWSPNVHNIMSYAPPRRREYLSPMQVGTMYRWIMGLPNGSYEPLNNSNSFVDVYEPDNGPSVFSEELNLGITQHRGLHPDHNGSANNSTLSYCDQDWVRFTVSFNSTIKVNIRTDEVPNRPQVNTELFLIDTDRQSVLTSNDDKAPGDQYSAITEYELTGGTYWIRVESNGNSAGEYYLNVENCAEDCCYQDLIGSFNEVSSNTGPFNLGVRAVNVEEYLGNSLNVTDNLFFNDDSELGFGTGDYPLSGTHLDAVICADAEIVIDNDGEMVLGHAASNLSATVQYTEGTTLRV